MVICLQITNNKAQRSFLVNFLEDWISPIQNEELFKFPVKKKKKKSQQTVTQFLN